MLKNILNNLNRSKWSSSEAADERNGVDKPKSLEDGKVFGEALKDLQQTKDIDSNTDSPQVTSHNDDLNNNYEENCSQDSSTSAKKKRLISRKGRKRLSAMMSRLQSSIQSAKSMSVQRVSPKGDDGSLNGLTSSFRRNKLAGPYDLDDDENYKSAEEMHHDDDDDDDAKTRPRITSSTAKAFASSQKSKPSIKCKSIEQQSIDELLPEEECDIPTFLHTENCDPKLINETRRLLRERYANNPDSFYDTDYKRMLSDDWTVSRFLLRRRLDPKRTAKLMEECGRFRRQYKMSEVQLWEFPMEFHKAGGLFKYAPDRVGNITLYMRVKMYRRVPEISDVFKAFILCVLEECDRQNNGRGTAIIFDLSACGLQNVDLGFLSWLLSSFRNYCPKGVSYIIVYNLPWILNATCKLAMTWMSASNRRALRFAYGAEIEAFIPREHLPDYCGGTCKINYRAIPEGSLPAIEVCERLDMSKEQALKIRELFKEYLTDDNGGQLEAEAQVDSKSHYFDAKSLTSNVELTATSDITTTTTTTTTTSDNDALTDNGGSQTTSESVDATTTTTANSAPAIVTNQQVPRIPVVDLVSRASKFIAH